MILLPDVLGIYASQDLGTYHTIKIERAEKQKLCKISNEQMAYSLEKVRDCDGVVSICTTGFHGTVLRM